MIRLISGISTSLRMRTLWKPSLKDSQPGGDDDDDSDGDYFTMQMAGDEYPPLSSLKEKSERLAVDQEGRDFYDDNDDGDDVAGDDGVDDAEEEGDLTEGQ